MIFNNNYSRVDSLTQNFMYKVYGLMAFALSITSAIAYVIGTSPVLMSSIISSPLFLIAGIAQIGLVMFLSWRLQYLSYATAVTAFLGYSALCGVTFSVFFYAYTMESIYLALAVTAGTFFAMALYGYFTKSDLSGLNGILTMGIFGLFIAMFANWFFNSPVADYYISLAAVGIFTLLTAYDTQKIKNMGQYGIVSSEDRNKLAVFGALILYLDFINLFIHLLRLLGKKKD